MKDGKSTLSSAQGDLLKMDISIKSTNIGMDKAKLKSKSFSER